jgi:beta-lactamase class A
MKNSSPKRPSSRIRIRSVRLILFCGLLAVPFSSACAQSSSSAQESTARPRVEALVHTYGADVGVAFRSLDDSQQLFLQADVPFPADTTITKLPVMIELYAEAKDRELRLTDTIVVRNHFPNPNGGPDIQLGSSTDPDPSLYSSIGKYVSLRSLCDSMIRRKSSLATALLIERLGPARIQQRLVSMHAEGIVIPLTFDPASAASGDSAPVAATATARSVLHLLWALAQGKAVSPEASQEMIGLIAHSGSGTSNAAALADAQHEAMIVYGPHSFILVIFVRSVKDSAATSALMGEIAHELAATL